MKKTMIKLKIFIIVQYIEWWFQTNQTHLNQTFLYFHYPCTITKEKQILKNLPKTI